MKVAGLISGTSVDGIDVAVVEVDDARLDLIASATHPYPSEVRERILSVSNRQTHTAEISRLNFLLAELFAEALRNTASLADIALIGSHGQTIFHESGDTLQIGEGAVIAERTGIPVFCDFRVADVAAGGKGAPLVPFLDYRVFCDPAKARVALNIGGIANITFMPAAAEPSQVIAFDTGPGNMILDALCPPFDRNGEKARQGAVNEKLLRELLSDPYFSAPPPKAAGREQYGSEFLERTGIDLTTAVELTARTIAAAIDRLEPAEVIVSGGGAHNGYLMERLRSLLPRQQVMTSNQLGIDIDAKEAMLFALLAYESFQGRPGNVPSATGASHPCVLGKLCRPYHSLPLYMPATNFS